MRFRRPRHELSDLLPQLGRNPNSCVPADRKVPVQIGKPTNDDIDVTGELSS